MSRTISRRLLTSSSLSAIALAYSGSHELGDVARAQEDGTPVAEETQEPLVGEALAPAWRFAVSVFEDPYLGTIGTPTDAPPGTRFIGAIVVITNDSEQPLEFRANSVRLRTTQGFQYPAGDVIGTEPRLVSQNLPDGERTRGWVWFAVPSDSQPSEIAFDGPAPTFRVDLPTNS